MDNTRQKGIALLLVCFALLLLSVIGLGMMYSTNMETAINSNYRDKQVALYAALAGLQEGRERIKYPYSVDPSNSTVAPPSALPATTFQNIVYFVANASTVVPWLNTNAYFDTELCHENILSPSVTAVAAGIPCPGPYTTLPAWFISYDDSTNTLWNTNLDLKWVRIQLKANNNTPVPVDGNPTNGSQACWTGFNQVSTPTTYTQGCQPSGGVIAVYMSSSGMGYTSTPTVAFTGGGPGSGATGHAHLSPEVTGVVASIAMTTGGATYTAPPTVTITDPLGIGTGATAIAVLSTSGVATTNPGTVTAISMTTGGVGYTTAPAVSFTGGGGFGASATAILSSSGVVTTTGYVSTVTMTTGGASYTSAPTVSLTGGGGSGATATAVLSPSGGVMNISVGSVGTQCYSQASDVGITFTGGGGSGAAATAVLEPAKSCVYSVTVVSSPQCSLRLNAADGFNPADQAAGLGLSVGSSSGFSGTLFVATGNDKTPNSVSIQNPGHDATNYSANTFTANLQQSGSSWACSNITVTATTGYRLASINVTNAGTGYTSAPTVGFSGGVGSTSTPSATATLGYPIASVNVTAGGSGYTSNPTVAFSSGGGSGAAANAAIITTSTTTYPVASVQITAGGTGYVSAPTVSFSGGSGTGAAATASVGPSMTTTYPVQSVTVQNGGSGYSFSTAPLVTFSGGGGSGAAATATVGAGMATGLYYVDSVIIDMPGTGYTFNPTVAFTGGGYTVPATAIAQIASGARFGQVWLVTAFAQTKNGARAMLQQEVASEVFAEGPNAALVLDGANPNINGGVPNSVNFFITGNDANSCNQTQLAPAPAIDGFDDPNANPPTNSVQTIVNALPRPANITGAGGTPSVQNGFDGLGEEWGTPAGLSAEMSNIQQHAVNWNSSNVSGFNPNSTTLQSINYVTGDLTLNGNGTGNGILVVTGTLTMSGNFGWNGIIYVVGQGNFQGNGGGNGQINGSLWVANISPNPNLIPLLPQNGSPTFNWNGGGNNGVQFDHCLTDNLMAALPPPNFQSTKPLKTLSFRILPY